MFSDIQKQRIYHQQACSTGNVKRNPQAEGKEKPHKGVRSNGNLSYVGRNMVFHII